MNTNLLKSFAQQARTKLMSQIAAKLEMVLTTDSGLLREQAAQIEKLNEAIAATSKEQVIDKVAYTWFNRFMALRFMDVNGYQPIGVQVISPKQGYTLPELLDEAKQGHIPTELNVDHERINDLLNGKIQSNNPQNEVYKMLLIAACNHLNKVFPFLFEHINDYTELLLPDDLTSEFSILQDVRDGMTDEDCSEVEIIGWLYQFYISERKDEVFAAKGRVEKEDIPAATQLFTPRWIVEYMVQNTVGKLWLQNRPNSSLREYMSYYIESPSATHDDYLRINSPEEITLLDQACGSGHILVYGFELLTKIYEEEGYNPTEIPQLIIEKNLYGFEIDERAAQLASMALMMKARSYQRRVFRKSIEPNILCFQDLTLTEEEIKATFHPMKAKLSKTLLSDLLTMQQATNYGSLIIPETSLDELEAALIEISVKNRQSTDVFGKQYLEELEIALKSLVLLGNKYSCVADNPPYMGSGNMNKELSNFVKNNYADSKADMMACFMEAGLKSLQPKGFLGMINQHSWMFLSSYEKLRDKLIKETFFDTLLHLGPRTFPEIGGEVVQNAAFTFWNKTLNDKGSYIRLVDDGNTELKRTKTLEAIQNTDCGWFYNANQKDFEKIPGSPIGYWLSEKVLKLFEHELLNKIGAPKKGLVTTNDIRFIRNWNEVAKKKFNAKWFFANKGGGSRKWYGLKYYVLNWKDDGCEMKDYVTEKSGGHYSRQIFNEKYYFKKGITWSNINTGKPNFRISEEDSLFCSSGPSAFPKRNLIYILGLLNTKPVDEILEVLSPTMSVLPTQIGQIPYVDNSTFIIEEIINENIVISRDEWNSNESSFDFEENPLIKQQNSSVEEAYQQYLNEWESRFYQLHYNEEKLNSHFIEIYGLNDELTPDVSLKDVTILKDELDQKKLKELSNTYKSGWQLINGEWQLKDKTEQPDLPFDAKEVIKQFVSYAVGCMFGRYSLDKEGLILANQGETLEDYIAKVGVAEEELQFVPDEDNIIPILDDEWFKDDMVGLFNAFLKRSFGKENFEQNLAFVEESLGRDMRNYFLRDFYTDHVRRYKKRPIYWLFSSPKGSFNVLIYMHRYTPDTLNRIFNNYLTEYREKLKMHSEQLNHIIEKGEGREQTQAAKELDKIKTILLELQEYERDILHPLATDRIPIDLDDGVLVNYNKFGEAIKQVAGLNDKKTKKKVKGFDWIDGATIR